MADTYQMRLSIQIVTTQSFPQIYLKVVFDKFEGPIWKYNYHDNSSSY